MINETLTPKQIWITPGTMLSEKKQLDNDVKYIRADRHAALRELLITVQLMLIGFVLGVIFFSIVEYFYA